MNNEFLRLGFVTASYVIMNISIAWTTDKLKITYQETYKPERNK